MRNKRKIVHKVVGRGQIKFNGVKYTIRHWAHDPRLEKKHYTSTYVHNDYIYVTKTSDEYHVKYPNNIKVCRFTMEGEMFTQEFKLPKEIELFVRQWIVNIKHSMRLKDYVKAFNGP